MNRVLITGANGFIGANLCRYFLDKGWEVTAVASRKEGWPWRLTDHINLNIICLDITSCFELMALFDSVKPEIIINCAAYGGYSNQTEEGRIYSTNFTAVRYMLEGASFVGKDFKAFIQLGTSSEYGLNSAGPDETSHTIPNSHYAISKLAATSLCQYYGKVHKVPTCVLRLGSVYGPFEDPGRLVMKALLEAKAGRRIEIVDRPITRDFVHIEDVCRAVHTAIDFASRKPGEIFNISFGHASTLKTLMDIVANEFEMPPMECKINPGLARPWDHGKNWYMDCLKAQDDLDWMPDINLQCGIMQTRTWIDANPEIIKNMRSVYDSNPTP